MRYPVRFLGSLVGLLLLWIPAASTAATFYVVQSGPEAWTVMDPQGIETIPGGALRKAWAVRVQRNILTGNPPQPGYVRTLSEYDCDQTRSRWREFAAFSRSGAALISKRNPNPEWGPATETPDTYAAFKVVCLGDGGHAVISAESVAKVVISLMAAWDAPVPATRLSPTAPVKPSAPPPAAKPAIKTAPLKRSTATPGDRSLAIKAPVAAKPKAP